MTFSIVVPSFNQARYLPECLDSLVGEVRAGTDVEIIVMDGGSTDASPDIVRSFR